MIFNRVFVLELTSFYDGSQRTDRSLTLDIFGNGRD